MSRRALSLRSREIPSRVRCALGKAFSWRSTYLQRTLRFIARRDFHLSVASRPSTVAMRAIDHARARRPSAMCRALVYLGKPTLLDDFLYRPDSSLVRQSHDPRQLHMLNLVGFGMMAWRLDSPNSDEPLSYHSTELPIFSCNLKSIAIKTVATCLLAHVRGIACRPQPGFGNHNLHPFRYPGFKLAFPMDT